MVILGFKKTKQNKTVFESETRGNEMEMQKLWSVSEGLISGCDNDRWGKGEDHWK